MKNLNGYLKKVRSLYNYLGVILFLSLLLPLSPNKALASTDSIAITTAINYTIGIDGDLYANVKLNLTNTDSSPTILKLYSLNVPFTNISEQSVRSSGRELDVKYVSRPDSTDLNIELDNEPVYGGKTSEIDIQFKVSQYMYLPENQNGIKIPVKYNSTNSNRVVIQIDKAWGELKYVLGSSATINEVNGNTSIILDTPKNEVVSLVFDEVYGYSFNIQKRLENSGDIELISEISIPRSQFNQSIVLQSIEPMPDLAYKDEAGNLLLAYKIQPNYYLDIIIDGSIIFTENNEHPLAFPLTTDYLTQSGVWEISDDNGLNKFNSYLRTNGVNIQENNDTLPANMDSATREKFYALTYQYVVNTLETNEDLESITLANRAGANTSINGVENPSIDDYNDLMIALFRKYGVPARVSIGYVTNVTEQYEKPFIHSWVEYWDKDSGWRLSDPALADASGSYLHNLKPLDHISFLTRSTSPTSPNLHFFSNDPIAFTPISVAPNRNSSIKVESNFEIVDQIKAEGRGSIKVSNVGNTILQNISISEANGETAVELKDSEIVLPGQTIEIPIYLNLGDSAFVNSQDGKLALTFNISSETTDLQPFTEQHEVNISVSSHWWWQPLLYAITSLLFILVIGIFYVLQKRLVNDKNWFNNFIDKFL